MDAIKKKMQSLKSETENSLAKAEQLDAEAKDANNRAEKTEEHVSASKRVFETFLQGPPQRRVFSNILDCLKSVL